MAIKDLKPYNNIDNSILYCRLLVDVLEYADGRREDVKDTIIDSAGVDVIASFFGKSSYEVCLNDTREMIDFLLDLAEEARDLADILDDYVPDEDNLTGFSGELGDFVEDKG